MIVVATEEERRLAENVFKGALIVETGVGAVNVINALKDVPRDTEIINYGYVGSNMYPKGMQVTVGKCKLYHPNVEYEEPEYKLSGYVDCYTAGDFVTETNINYPCVFDMELAYIMALGFENVRSIKIVSDKLDINEYTETVGGSHE